MVDIFDISKPYPLTIILLAGLPGSGKTTLAYNVYEKMREIYNGFPQFIVLDKDTLKSCLKDNNVSEKVAASVSYELLWSLVEDFVIKQRQSVIIDTPFRFDFMFDICNSIAEKSNAILKIIYCYIEPEESPTDGKIYDIRQERLENRHNRSSQLSSLHFYTKQQISEVYNHLPQNSLKVNTILSMDQCVNNTITFLSDISVNLSSLNNNNNN
eukprot:TRINITY_DN298_c0_g2_i1.p1 TRINITY_DN298_c0_g2~~TRINITY_DN298_c0_g2_i1.p1  ORF type:complete len:213 (-),score=52.10 TRINITY_DN298_c0_g2_i1:164-802(-)